jgi:hypothetical protein
VYLFKRRVGASSSIEFHRGCGVKADRPVDFTLIYDRLDTGYRSV